MSVALPEEMRSWLCLCRIPLLPCTWDPSHALSSTVSSPGWAKPEEPPDFFSLAQCQCLCSGCRCCWGTHSMFPPGTLLQDGGTWGWAVWWGQDCFLTGGTSIPSMFPRTTIAKPSTACKIRISCLFPLAVCGEPLPFHHHSRRKSSESDLHTHPPCVGGFMVGF